MADNVIKVSVTSTKSQRVSVSSSQQATNITASPDTGRFWSQTSKNWAVSENIVDGEDYSSKYYANKSKESANTAKSYLETTQETYSNFVTSANGYISNLTELKETGTQEINEAVASGKDEINSAKTTILNDIEFVADGEKKEIEDLADLIKENAEEIASRTSFAMFDTILKDHVLTYEESKGLALQGTWVYKEAVAGSRYGYPDFYNKCLKEYNESVGERWVQPVLTANGVLGGNTFAVSANGEASNTPAYKMFDNDNSTYWYGATNGKGYVTLYNPTPLNIVNLKITNSQWVEDNIATGEILVSNNGTDWAKILTFTGNTASNATWEIDLNTNGGFYKYYKINILSLGSTSYPPAIVNLEIITGNLVKNTNGHLFYDIADKDIIDSIFESTGVAWFYGIDQENERIFLPRNNYFAIKGAIDNIPVVGNGMSLGFTKGDVNYGMSVYDTQGNIQMFRTTAYGVKLPYSVGANGTMPSNSVMGITTDATKSGIIAETSDVLKIDDSKYLYICVGNTEATSTVTDVVDVTTTDNDTTPLFTGMYFDFKPNNPSWLKGGEQSSSGGIYKTCYNELVNELTFPKYNLKVINESDMIAGVDYSEFWKVNQEALSFTCPIRTEERILVAKKEPTDSDATWYNLYSDGWLEQGGKSYKSSTGASIISLPKSFIDTNYTVLTNGGIDGASNSNSQADYLCQPYNLTTSSFTIQIHTALGHQYTQWQACGYAEIPTTSDYTENVNLYFKVANAVQNLELLDAGEVLEAVAEIASNAVLKTENKAYIVETYVNGKSWYRIWSDGWIEQGGYVSSIATGKTITFLKPFKDTNYIPLVVKRSTSNTGDNGTRPVVSCNASSKNSMTVYNIWTTNDSTFSISVYWEAKGY